MNIRKKKQTEEREETPVTLRKVRYRLYPRPWQEATLLEELAVHQQLYNAALEQRISAYKRQGVSLNFAMQCRELTALRQEDPTFGERSCKAQQRTLARLEKSFAAFFRQLKKGQPAGFPKFKALDRYPGWEYSGPGTGWRFYPRDETHKHGRLELSRLCTLTARGKPRTVGELKTLEITRRGDKWFATMSIACEPQRARGEGRAALSWGIEYFATLVWANGEVETIANPRHLQNSLLEIKATQRELSARPIHSKGWLKLKRRLNKQHAAIAAQRDDFTHKLSAQLVERVSHLVVPSLDVKKLVMEKNPKEPWLQSALNRSILDAAPAGFISALKYKCEEAGVRFSLAPTATLKPSQTCHKCGKVELKSLDERMHRCECGAECHRSENAARVMLAWAITNDWPAPKK